MSRPTDKDDQKPAAGPAANSKHMKDIEMKERSSRSLLANVLDIDDDFRQHSCTLSSVGSGMALSMGVPTGFPRVVSTPSGGLGTNQGKMKRGWYYTIWYCMVFFRKAICFIFFIFRLY